MLLYIMCSRTFADLVEAEEYLALVVAAAVAEEQPHAPWDRMAAAGEVVQVSRSNWPVQRYSSDCPCLRCHSMKVALEFVVERTAAVAILAVPVDAAASSSSSDFAPERTALFVAIVAAVAVVDMPWQIDSYHFLYHHYQIPLPSRIAVGIGR